MREIRIASCEEGQRFDKYLRKYFKEAGSGFLYKMLRKKNIVLNGKKVSGNEILKTGDVVKMFLAEDTIAKFTDNIPCAESLKIKIIKDNSSVKADCIVYKNYKIEVLYEDDDVIFLNKPAGLLSQKAVESDVSLVEILGQYLKSNNRTDYAESAGFRAGICNRLDRNTSGIIVAGKSVKGLQTMSNVIKNREVSKFYRCIVNGIVTDEGHLKGYLVKDERANKVHLSENDVSGKAQYIETRYKPVAANGNHTLLEVELITGKSHQIRAHMASIGHPVVGDVKYGAPSEKELEHHLLHAYELRFNKEPGPDNIILDRVAGKSIIAPLPSKYAQYMGFALEGEIICHPGIQGD